MEKRRARPPWWSAQRDSVRTPPHVFDDEAIGAHGLVSDQRHYLSPATQRVGALSKSNNGQSEALWQSHWIRQIRLNRLIRPIKKKNEQYVEIHNRREKCG